MRVSPVLTLAAILGGFAGAHAQVQQFEPLVTRPEPVIVQPVVIGSIQPNYTAEALRARIAGEVHVNAVVRVDGTVADAQIVKSLDRVFGLDEQALRAVRRWTFRPGTVDGKPVSFSVTSIVEFRIRETGTPDRVEITEVRVVGQAPAAIEPSLIVAGVSEPTQKEPTVYHPGPGVTLPRPILRVSPRYTTDAMRRKVQGEVHLEAVVRANGTVGDLSVTKPLDSGLDQAAIKAARRWRFTPGSVDGKAVPVLMTLVLEFRLTEDRSPRLLSVALPGAQPASAPEPELTPEEFAEGTYPDSTLGLMKPRPAYTPPPRYTVDAMRAGVQGDVEVAVVVMPDGRVGRTRVAKSLDPMFGLDAEALATARMWKFIPAQLDGKPVPVVTTITLKFRLRDHRR